MGTVSDSVVLVGWSASCGVVVEAARRSPRVAGLVLIGPVTDPRARTWPRMLSQWIRTATHEQIKEVFVLAPQYYRTGVGSMVRGMDEMRSYRTDLALSGVRVPVLVVRGERDRIAAQDWSLRLADLALGRLVTIDGGAHMVPLTHPDAVAAAVTELV
jgi:pimeloyl-ACP methyl ester carboxylesterase